jgi:hypothetical protein
MYSFNVDLIAVLVAGIAAMIIGSLWYSPVLFGKQWMALVGTEGAKPTASKMSQIYLMAFALALVSAFILAIFLKNLFVPLVTDAVRVAILIWIGFVAAIYANSQLFTPGKKSGKLFLILNGYYLVVLIVQSIIIYVLG